MNRGFVFTIFSLVFFGLLLTSSFSWLSLNDSFNSYSFESKQLSKIALFLDDASFIFLSVYPFSFQVEQNGLSYSTLLNDYNHSFLLSANQAISDHFSSVTDLSFSSTVEFDLNEPAVFSNGEKVLSFGEAPNNSHYVAYQETIGVSLNQIDENVFVPLGDLNHATPWSWDPSGSVSVFFTYKDAQTTVPLSGKLNPSQMNEYVFSLSDGSVLTIQLFTQNDRVVWKTISSNGLVADVNARVLFSTVDENTFYTLPIPYELTYRGFSVDGNLSALSVR